MNRGVPRDYCEGERFKATTSFSTAVALGLQYFRQLKVGFNKYVYTKIEIKSNLFVQFLNASLTDEATLRTAGRFYHFIGYTVW